VTTPVVLSWSSGKDSAFALQALNDGPDHEVVGLLTALHEDAVTMHGTPGALVRAQARAAGLTLHTVTLPWPCPNEVYEAKLGSVLRALAAEGIAHVAFGDLFLEDIRHYRESLLAPLGMNAVFPLWRRPTATLARTIIDSGIGAQLVCVDTRQLPASLAGRSFSSALLDELPPGADPCGENGEFHTFVWGSPVFDCPLEVHVRGYEDDGRFARALLASG